MKGFLMILLPLANFGADAFLLQESTTLYKKMSGNSQVVGMPSGAVLLPRLVPPATGDSYLVPAGVFGRDLAVKNYKEVCNPDTERWPVFYFSRVSRSWEKGFIEHKELKFEIFQYEPKFWKTTLGTDGPLIPQSLTDGVTLYVDGKINEKFNPPEIQNKFYFEFPLEEVWPAIIAVLGELQIPFKLVEGSSGLITTKPIQDRWSETMVCGSTIDKNHFVEFNLVARGKEKRTSLQINAIFVAEKLDQKIACFSSGKLEDMIYKATLAELENF